MTGAASAAQQDEPAADGVDRDVDVAVVVDVGGGEAAAVLTREPVEPHETGHVRELAVQVLEHLHRAAVGLQIGDGDRSVREHEVEVAVVVEVDPRVAPAGEIGAEGGREGGLAVGERLAAAAEHRMSLPA